MIDLSLYSEEQVREVQGGAQWPLVIRLECVTKDGLEQGHSLSVSTSPHPPRHFTDPEVRLNRADGQLILGVWAFGSQKMASTAPNGEAHSCQNASACH